MVAGCACSLLMTLVACCLYVVLFVVCNVPFVVVLVIIFAFFCRLVLFGVFVVSG